MKEKILLDIKGLTVCVEEKKLVSEINLVLPKNQITALVGASGSGKSLTALSLLNILPNTLKWQCQKFLFDEKDVLTKNSKAWEAIRGNEIGMIFQEPQSSLNPSMPCGQQVLEALLQHQKKTTSQAKKEVLLAFEKVQLPDPNRIYNAYPHEISGGQKQRVMIAMALINNPKLLIADEPTTALDVTVQKEIIALIKKLQLQNNMSVLFISHDLELVQAFADHVYVMQNGKIVESGPCKALFKNPQHPYTKGLINSRPPLDKRPETLPTIADFLNHTVSIKNITNAERVQRHLTLFAKKPLLEVFDLEKHYLLEAPFWKKKKVFQAVKKLSFDLYPGETLGLVGESGCGKSTLARALLFLDPPTSGSVFFEGKALNKMDKKTLHALRKKIQYIFQDPFSALHPLKKIGPAIEEVIRLHFPQKNKIQVHERSLELLEQVGLSQEFYHRYPHEMSGGQRQRAVIARALATEPLLIICDEAVAALDISVQAQVINLLRRLQKQLGITYLFISHDLAVVKYLSDRILVMNRGQIEELEEADLLYENPQKDYTKKLIAALPSKVW